MADDIVPILQKRIDRLIKSGIAANPAMRKQPESYKAAQTYAINAGKVVSRALSVAITEDILPDGKMYFNIADRTVRPSLEELHKIVSIATKTAQESVNKKAGIGINAITPDANDDKIKGIIDRLAEAENFNDIKWILKNPVVNFSQSVVDDFARANADFQSKSGVSAKIVRTCVGKCCKWCEDLSGVYDYPLSNTDVYRRHENCNCIVEYVPSTGKAQNVWSKKWK